MDGVLAQNEYLVGGKLTIADLAFIGWNEAAITRIMPKDLDLEKEFPAVTKYECFSVFEICAESTTHRWHNYVFARDSLKKVYAIRASLADQ